jgi:hypothetical protein
MVTTLEFVPDPRRALREAIRVASQGLVLGVLNRASLLARKRRKRGESPWNVAHFYSPGELRDLVQETAGMRLRGIRWKTTLWPFPILGSLPLRWGGFIGLAAALTHEERKST